MTATSSPSPPPPPTKNVFRLHGVNVLNRKNVDSISRLSALERRRTTHILDERQRRDTMNQLLGELANLVRESSEDDQQQPQQPQARQKQYNSDGTEKRPPVKSNSITTLRNAINEIRRLRNCAGLETATQPCAASLAVVSPNASRSSSPMDISTPQPQSQQQKHLLPSPAPMASQYAPLSSRPTSSSEVYANHAQSNMYPSHHQLQSPPLSPSSPKNLQYSVSPPMIPVQHQAYQAHPLPSLFASNPQQQQSQSYHQPQPKPYHHGQVPIQYRQPYDQQSVYKPQYSPTQSEPSQPFSRSSSPGFSGPMMLPQPYIQHPASYQTSYAQV
ncbi:hypothetical protein BGZ76_009962 [Entomortierella beljakovae]|nr:hypothetical protein BGZ76_009962 [Entomortierella beljakovae]